MVAIAVTASGAAVIDHSLDQSAAGHVVGQVDVGANASTVEVTHLGGDDFAPETLTAVLKSERDSVRVPFTNGTIDGDDRFVAGTTWRYDYAADLDGHLQKVYVVYTPKNDVLDVERFENRSKSENSGDSGVLDPGFAYLDTNRDTNYDDGSDVQVSTGNLSDGLSVSERLVVPESVSVEVDAGTVLSADGIYLSGTLSRPNHHSTSGLVLNATDSPLELRNGSIVSEKAQASVTLTGSRITAVDSTIAADGRVRLDTPGKVDLTRSTLRSTKDTKKATLSVTGSQIAAIGANISAKAQISLVTTGGDLDLRGVTVTVEKRQRDVVLDATGGDIDLTNATLVSGAGKSRPGPKNDLTATVDTGYGVTVTNATFVDADHELDVTPDGAAVGTASSGGVN